MKGLRIEVENFQAISKASIVLDGITILTGENSSGKSTLSKLLYFSVDYILQYEKELYKKLFVFWSFTIDRLYSYAKDLSLNVEDKFQFLDFDEDYDKAKKYFMLKYNAIKSVYLTSNIDVLSLDPKRLLYIVIPSKFLNDSLDKIESVENLEQVFDFIEIYFTLIDASCIEMIKTRPVSDFTNAFIETGMSTVKKENINLIEFGNPIVTEKRMNNIYSIENVIYNDSPSLIFSVDAELFSRKNRLERYNYNLRKLLLKDTSPIFDDVYHHVFNELSNVIGGVVQSEQIDVKYNFTYTRKTDNLKIKLSDSATGIKQFAILQLLLEKKLINDKTLLILDEPEAHLHPQWIVEYARMVVLLNKYFGVKFLLATHSPDFINALRSIAEKEKVLDKVQMYLSVKEENKEQYCFSDLGVDIEPIFESFNIALDRISQYGV
ncbi:MAG: AAA family ATPase [Paludibacteraceae bacterium]|nr:AAA family ATPase [Paludibacteraceae bacterium]